VIEAIATILGMFALLGVVGALFYEAIALRSFTDGTLTISEIVRWVIRRHPLLTVAFVLLSVWFPLHILEVIPF